MTASTQYPFQPALRVRFPAEEKRIVADTLDMDFFTQPRRTAVSTDDTPVTAASSIETNGWDTVYAVRATDLNRAIAQKKTYPKECAYLHQDEDDKIEVTGQFAAWEIAPGGDGSNVNIKIPFISGSMGINAQKKHDLSGGIVVAQIKLAYFPEVLSNPVPGDYDLKMSVTSIDPCIPIVSIINYVDGKTKLGTMVKAALKDVMQEWFSQNLDKFNNIFATLSMEKLSASTEFKWLKSTHMSYAYTDTGDLSSSIMGILCMTNNRNATGLARQIDSHCLKENEKASFVIKKELFAKYQFMPSLPQIFNDAKASDFTLNKTENGITAANLKMDSIRYGAIDYNPQVESFEVWFEQSYIRTMTKIRTKISAGIYSLVTIQTYNTLKFVNKNGKQYLEYESFRAPEVTKTTETATWVVITEVIADLILAIVGVMIGKAIESITKRVIIGIIIVIVAALIGVVIHQILERVIAQGIEGNMPPIAPMAKLATKPVLWPLCDKNDPERFILKNVSYNGSVILCGDPGYIS